MNPSNPDTSRPAIDAEALAAKDLRDKLDQQGVEIAAATSPEQFSALLRTDLAKWARIVKASGAAVD